MTTKSSLVWVVFDFGGVILTTGNRDEYEAAMTTAVKLVNHPSITSPSELKKRVYDGPEFQLAKTGKISSAELYQRIFSQYGITDEQTVTLCRDAVRSAGKHFHPKLAGFVQSLKSRPGHRVAVLSNYESDLLEMITRHGIDGAFPQEAIMSSYDLGSAKPSAECFRAAREHLRRLTRKECRVEAPSEDDGTESAVDDSFSVVFIDDKEKNVTAAGNFGFQEFGVVYKSVEQCIADVEAALATALAKHDACVAHPREASELKMKKDP
jgi:FMN phosphatase YigB (HAD superfamily)